jgi:hypothetical protein
MEHRSLSPQTLAAQALGETDPATGALAPVSTCKVNTSTTRSNAPAQECGGDSRSAVTYSTVERGKRAGRHRQPLATRRRPPWRSPATRRARHRRPARSRSRSRARRRRHRPAPRPGPDWAPGPPTARSPCRARPPRTASRTSPCRHRWRWSPRRAAARTRGSRQGAGHVSHPGSPTTALLSEDIPFMVLVCRCGHRGPELAGPAGSACHRPVSRSRTDAGAS